MSDEWEIGATLSRIEDSLSQLRRDQELFSEKLLKLLGEAKGDILDLVFELRQANGSLSEAVTALQALDEHFTQHDDD
jgi:hypothetical protein